MKMINEDPEEKEARIAAGYGGDRAEEWYGLEPEIREYLSKVPKPIAKDAKLVDARLSSNPYKQGKIK